MKTFFNEVKPELCKQQSPDNNTMLIENRFIEVDNAHYNLCSTSVTA